jgi:hypothetical protein
MEVRAAEILGKFEHMSLAAAMQEATVHENVIP